jgi:Uncharacterised BCR, YnfA/UPF0060 family
MQTIFAYVAAAVAEIAGCFAFWAWLRLDKSALWLIPGSLSLLSFICSRWWTVPRRAALTPPMEASTSLHRSRGCGASKACARIAGM